MYLWDLKDIIHTTLSLRTTDGTSETNFMAFMAVMAAFSHLRYKYVNWTDLERLIKSVFVVELKTSPALSLRKNCLSDSNIKWMKIQSINLIVTKCLTF